MLQSFEIIKDRLKKSGYDGIQFLPSRRSLLIGKEFYVFRSFFYQNGPCLFHSTCFYTLYHLAFRKRYPGLYRLYKICFMNETADEGVFLNLFSADEMDEFIKDGIINARGRNYRFNFRFIPLEGLFLVAKADMEDREYVHLNYDSITFLEFLRKICFGRRFKRALEIGCGAGLISIELAKVADSVEAVDINPHAVTMMDINAKLNDVANITSLLSDCYNSVREKYDLIVSDPPFELMPEEGKDVLHRYGGNLGMEVALKIFEGLDSYLTETGEAVIFTNSYIRNFKANALKDALYDMFRDKKFALTLYTLSYQITPEFYPVYRRYNISHSIGYFIHVRRADDFRMDIVPLNLPGEIKEMLRLFYLYVLIFFRRSGKERVKS